MQLKNLLAFLAAASAVQASTDFVEDFMEEDALENRSSACTKGVHIVAAGGEGSVKGTLGYLQTLVDDIRGAIPGSNLFQAGYSPGADPGTSIGQGVAEMNRHLRAYVKKCPKSKIALVGYSVGGAAVTDVLCGDVYTGDGALPDRFRKHVIASIVYGDPTFVPNLDYDRGTCTGQGASDVPRQKPGACFPFGKHLRSYCDYNDPECCGGNDPNVHFEYPGLYDGKATAHVKKRWQQSKN